MRKRIILLSILGLTTLAFKALAFSNPAQGLFVDFSAGGGSNDFLNVIVIIIRVLLGFVGVLSIFYLVLGGFRMMLAGANPALAESGKKTLKNALLGLIIVIMSYIIVTVVVNSVVDAVQR